MAFRILLVGGGTGGHVFPLIAVANSLQNKAQQSGADLDLLVLGDGKMLRDACIDNSLKFKSVVAGKFRRYLSFLNLLDILKMPIGFIQSLWYIFWFMPDVVFTKGGYASFIPAIVAKIYAIPLLTHDSDAVPGLTNRWIGKMANGIFISFKSAGDYFVKDKAILTGNPVRTDLLNGRKEEALKAFNLKSDKKVILVLGGSQGAKIINDTITQSLVIIAKDYQIIHQCGDGQLDVVKSEVEKITKEGETHYADLIKNNYRLYPFFGVSEMRLAYAVADIIISRAGAANIFEIAALGKPAIIIPLGNSASNHQFLNAKEFSQSGAVMIEEQNLTPHIILNQIENLLNPENYLNVSEKIKSFALVDAADKVAEQILLLNNNDR